MVEVLDRDGWTWFGKRLHLQRQWNGETNGYRWWSGLDGVVPQLRDQHDELRALIMAGLPGRPADPGDAAAYRGAGALLSRMHAAQPARDDGGEWLEDVRAAARFETDRCRRLGVPVDELLVSASLDGLTDLQATPVVPCHGDFLPHNWLLDEQGEVRTLDFAESGWRPLAHDFARLRFGPCWDRPALYAAFLEGYGRELTEAEDAFINLHLALNATTAVGWGTQHDHSLVRNRGLEVLDRLALGKPYPAKRSLSRRIRGVQSSSRPGRGAAAEPAKSARDIDAALSPPVLAWVRNVVRGPQLVGTPPQTRMARARGRVVYQLVDCHGQGWYLKVEPRTLAWEREVHAYRHWASAVPGLMPAMPFAHRELQVMLVTALPGQLSHGQDLDHYRRAGSWLQRFHGAEEPRAATKPFAAGRKLDRMRKRHPGVVPDPEFDFARNAATILEERPTLEPVVVPSHGDFRPQNWLVDKAGVLRVIDFGDSGWHPPTRDLAMLSHGWWQRTPGAKDAFLTGYGRNLTHDEDLAVFARSCHRALWEIYEGHRLGVRPSIRRGRHKLRALMDSSLDG